MQVSVESRGVHAAALRAAGFRATYGRVALLEALAKAKEPLSAEKLARRVKGKLDLVNTYRALEALSEAKLVRRVDMGHQHMHYASVPRGKHQHEFVCAACGARET